MDFLNKIQSSGLANLATISLNLIFWIQLISGILWKNSLQQRPEKSLSVKYAEKINPDQ